MKWRRVDFVEQVADFRDAHLNHTCSGRKGFPDGTNGMIAHVCHDNAVVLTAEIDARLRILLPPEYHDSYGTLAAPPMGGAGLQYDAEGRVAWDRIWQRFCDLAMAGGPPHKGRLLGPGLAQDIAAQPEAYLDLQDEALRGLTMASELPSEESPHLGWVRVVCHSEVMAQWMLRAITMENVAVRREGRALDLPLAPHFRVEKELKNIITVTAKTTHYWMGHIPREQKIAIGELFAALEAERPLIEPAWAEDGAPGWRAVPCASVEAALWLMRALVTQNILARREGTDVCVPGNPATDPDGDTVATTLRSLTHVCNTDSGCQN